MDWTENSSGLVFDVFNHEFPSEVLCPSPHAMSNQQLVDLEMSRIASQYTRFMSSIVWIGPKPA